MPRKSRKVKSEGVADPLAKQDEDQAALDAGEVSVFGDGVPTDDDVS